MNPTQCGRLLALLVLGTVLAACAAQKQLLQPDIYETRVLDDGAKRFVYGVSLGRSASSLPSARDLQSGGGFESQSRLGVIDLEEELEDWMAQDDFCISGYFVYDRQFDGTTYRLLGECRELANR